MVSKFFGWLTFISPIMCLIGCGDSGLQAIKNNDWDSNQLSSVGKKVSGIIDSSLADWHHSIQLDPDNRTLNISIPIPNLQFDSGEVRFPSQARLRKKSSSQSGSVVEVAYPLSSLLKNVVDGSVRNLPNGQQIPSMGMLKAEQEDVLLPGTNLKVMLYRSKGVLGVFVEVPYDPMLKTTVPIRALNTDSLLGAVYTVPQAGQTLGGILAVVKLPKEVLKQLEK